MQQYAAYMWNINGTLYLLYKFHTINYNACSYHTWPWQLWLSIHVQLHCLVDKHHVLWFDVLRWRRSRSLHDIAWYIHGCLDAIFTVRWDRHSGSREEIVLFAAQWHDGQCQHCAHNAMHWRPVKKPKELFESFPRAQELTLLPELMQTQHAFDLDHAWRTMSAAWGSPKECSLQQRNTGIRSTLYIVGKDLCHLFL